MTLADVADYFVIAADNDDQRSSTLMEAREALLTDVVAARSSANLRLRAVGSLVSFSSVRRGGPPVEAATAAEQVSLSADVAALVLRLIGTDFLMGVSQELSTVSATGDGLLRPVSPPARMAAVRPCEGIDDGPIVRVVEEVISKGLRGVRYPWGVPVVRDWPRLVPSLHDVILEKYPALQGYAARLAYAQVALDALKTFIARFSVRGQLTIDKVPMHRTPTTEPGELATLTATISYNLGDLAWVNCFRIVYALTTGLRFSVPVDGRLANAEVRFRGGDGFRGFPLSDPAWFVQFNPQAGQTLTQITGSDGADLGRVTMDVEGRPQLAPVRSPFHQFSRAFTVGLDVKPARGRPPTEVFAGDMWDLFGTVTTGTPYHAVAHLLVNVWKRLPVSLGPFEFAFEDVSQIGGTSVAARASGAIESHDSSVTIIPQGVQVLHLFYSVKSVVEPTVRPDGFVEDDMNFWFVDVAADNETIFATSSSARNSAFSREVAIDVSAFTTDSATPVQVSVRASDAEDFYGYITISAGVIG